MNLRKILRHSHLYAGLEQELSRVHTLLSKWKARWVIRRYLRQNSIRKLQIGAGPSKSSGWLVTDIDVKLRRTNIYLDATEPFPIPDASFDYVFSEHMIEHIPYLAACRMLKECVRVLKPGGRIRFATPDLDQFLGFNNEELNDSQRAYIAWSTKNFLAPGTPEHPIHVINNQFRNYGHQFLFDENCLRDAMTSAGFVDIRRMPMGESDDAHLNQVEKHGVNMGNEAMTAFETMVLEARKG